MPLIHFLSVNIIKVRIRSIFLISASKLVTKNKPITILLIFLKIGHV